jgi:hypothetical protein
MMLASAIGLDDIDRLTGGRHGQFDVACPLCGPQRRTPINQRRKVLRIWRTDPGFAGFHCARCGEKGHARDGSAPPPDPVKLAGIRVDAARRERIARGDRIGRARWLWGHRRPLADTAAERYLREVRCYGGPLPATLGFLPGRGDFPPAMIAGFGVPLDERDEIISISSADIQGVHITRLASDGSAKAGTDTDKITMGAPRGAPIILACIGDGLGLAVTEGIEDGLSVHEATGLGVWAAGSASLMPALATTVPSWVECVSVLVDDDRAGRQNADELCRRLDDRGIEVRLVIPVMQGSVAP